MNRFKTLLFVLSVVFCLFIGATSLIGYHIYCSGWWTAIWAVVAAGLLYGIVAYKIWKNIPGFLIHLSFILMITGGICTRYLSHRGTLTLHPGVTDIQFVEDDGTIRKLPTSITLISFSIPIDSLTNTPTDYISLICDGEGKTYRISMNHIARIGSYRFYQSSYDEYGGTILIVSHDPVGIGITYLGFLLFAIGGGWLMATRMIMGRRLIIFCLIIGLAWFGWLTGQSAEAHLPILSTPWLYVHIFFVIIGYSMLASASAISFIGLLRTSCLHKYVPLATKLLLPGVYMVGIGIIIGSMWANVSWGRYWGWDPKETWSLVTFLIYAIPLHRVFGLENRHRTLSYYLTFATLSIIMTYAGVNGLSSLHAYN